MNVKKRRAKLTSHVSDKCGMLRSHANVFKGKYPYRHFYNLFLKIIARSMV